jgi:hypothetical protein
VNVRTRLRAAFLLCALAFLSLASSAHAYSLLTHEQLIDLTWKSSIVPLLLSRYPTLTPAQLDEARAYAYGGCVIQDIGYYPFGDAFFSNLTHYVRTGDFVVSLFRNARNADELAFAVGALSHYIGDSVGHSEATNLAVPVEFPGLRHKYGSVVSYAEGEHQHVQTEFAFDINEVSHHRMAPLHFLRHIGLGVSTRQVAAAFYETYGLGEDFTKERKRRINVGGYRFSVRAFIPRIAYALTVLHRRHEPSEIATPDRVELDREIAQVDQENDWDRYRRRAGLGTYSLAGLIVILPKFGPLKLLAIKGPTQVTDEQYAHSVRASADALRARLARFTPPPALTLQASTSRANMAPTTAASTPAEATERLHPLDNLDLDTGKLTMPGSYRLTDSTFAELLHRLAAKPTQAIPPDIKQTIQAFYANPNAPNTTRKDPKLWAQVQADLAILPTMPISTEPLAIPTYDASPASSSALAPPAL